MRSANKFLRKKGLVTREQPLALGQYIRAARSDRSFTTKEELEKNCLTGYLAGFKKGSKGVSLLIALDTEEQMHEFANTAGWYGMTTANGYIAPQTAKELNGYLYQVDWQNVLEVRTTDYDYDLMLTSLNPYIRDLAKGRYGQ